MAILRVGEITISKKQVCNIFARRFCSFIILLFLCLLVGCSGESATSVVEPAPPIFTEQPSGNNIAIPDNRFATDYSIIIFGNSHTTGIAALIDTIITADDPSIAVHIESIGGGFLDSVSSNPQRLQRLQSRDWSHVILQGQKYSQSGTVSYSTIPAQNWISEAKKQDTTPVLFPEHPQLNNPGEGQRIHDLHLSISAEQASCIAPVGLVWERAIALRPFLPLHHPDGNHASDLGRVLTAMVFYEVITGYPANLLPYIPELEVSAEIQGFFGQMVSETIAQQGPCDY